MTLKVERRCADDVTMWVRAMTGAVALAALAACGSSASKTVAKPTIPAGADAATTLQVEIAQQLSGQGLAVTNIHCPAGVSPVEATTTTCTGVAAGQTLNLPVTFESDNQIIVTVAP